MLDTAIAPSPTTAESAAPTKPSAAPKSKAKKSRRGHGEGGVYQRKSDGRWCATWEKSSGPDGKRVRRIAYGSTKKEAIDNRKRLVEQEASLAANATKETVADFLARWLSVIASEVRPTTLSAYSAHARLYVAPVKDEGRGVGIGGVKLTSLTPLMIQEWLRSLEMAEVSAAQRRHLCMYLRTAFGRAVEWGNLKTNPMAGVRYPKADREVVGVWSAQEARAVLAAAKGERLEALFALALDTGMRQGELLGLRWKNVELRHWTDAAGVERFAGKVRVEEQLVELNGRHSVGPPKTKNGIRTVTLAPDTVRALIRHKARMMEAGLAASPLVFTSTTGGFYFRRTIRETFDRVVKRAGVKRIRFHDMRHTNATLLLTNKVDVRTVSGRLGHSSVVITLELYAKFVPEADAAAAGVLGSILGEEAA